MRLSLTVSLSSLAAFDYQFGALTNSKNEFMEAYMGLMYVRRSSPLLLQPDNVRFLTSASVLLRSDTLGSPPRSAIFMQTVLPVWVLQLMSKYSNRRNLVHARHTAQLANVVTRQLVDSKAEALLQGRENKDILSLLSGSGCSPY